MPADYVELRARTAFSFGDGSVTPEALAARAAELGYSALGMTDAADLGGVVRFVVAARKFGVRPVVGAELKVDGRPAAFLVRTAEGCRNLAALVTRARVGELAARPGGGDLGAGGRAERGPGGAHWARIGATRRTRQARGARPGRAAA